MRKQPSYEIASSSNACVPEAAPGPAAAAVAVDPATVPAGGPIAGYGGDQLVDAAHIMLAGQQLGSAGHVSRCSEDFPSLRGGSLHGPDCPDQGKHSTASADEAVPLGIAHR